MAEPCQLYMKVTISRSGLEAFRRCEVGSAARFEDLYQWLDGRRSGVTWSEACELGEGTSADFWLSRWDRHSRSPIVNHYDEASQTWTLAVLECAVSDDWVIGALNLLRHIADFKDRPGTDYLLIYDYLFGQGNVLAAVALEPGHSRILQAAPPPGLVADADRVMGGLLRAMDVSGRYTVQRISDAGADEAQV